MADGDQISDEAIAARYKAQRELAEAEARRVIDRALADLASADKEALEWLKSRPLARDAKTGFSSI